MSYIMGVSHLVLLFFSDHDNFQTMHVQFYEFSFMSPVYEYSYNTVVTF